MLILICGALSLNDKIRKHAMHFAAVLGVLGVLGGFAPIIRQVASGKELNLASPSAVAGLSMTLVCAAFVAMCVRSFVAARKAREAREAKAAAA